MRTEPRNAAICLSCAHSSSYSSGLVRQYPVPALRSRGRCGSTAPFSNGGRRRPPDSAREQASRLHLPTSRVETPNCGRHRGQAEGKVSEKAASTAGLESVGGNGHSIDAEVNVSIGSVLARGDPHFCRGFSSRVHSFSASPSKETV